MNRARRSWRASMAGSAAKPASVSRRWAAVGYRVTESSDLRPILEQALQQNRPVVIDCPVDYSETMKLTEELGNLVCPI